VERSVVVAFLASPSDVRAERETAFQVVESVNRSIRNATGWEVELLGWEESLPGAGRPQDLINPDLDRSQLFIGILWRRWGIPTGQYTSGFEEEFERAQRRNRDTGVPEIWMYLKAIPSDALEDPGPQLERVLAFRRKLEETGNLLWKEFNHTEQWETLFSEAMTGYVVKQAIDGIREPLNEQGLTLEALARGRAGDESVRGELERLLPGIEKIANQSTESSDPAWNRELARGFMTTGEWTRAAAHLDKYLAREDGDYEAHFARGVAYANSRAGRNADVTALRSYSQAVALLPADVDSDRKARYIDYRGAMLKRLGRLDEAEADLQLAAKLAEDSAIRNDIVYNLASIYALMGDRAKVLTHVRNLQGAERELAGIRYHLDDYFARFAADGEFRQLIGFPPEP